MNRSLPDRRLTLMLLCMLPLAALIGCTGEQERQVAMRRLCLSKLATAYHAFHDANNRGPKDLDEFGEFIESEQNDKGTLEALKRMHEGDILMFWNATMSDDSDQNDQYILGFEAACPGNGGYVVMGGGTVDHVTAKKFGTMNEIPRTDASVESEDAAGGDAAGEDAVGKDATVDP
ncbi:MAG: hypothetical protein HKN47_08555 [Pirellulaceae bacterium]|nr:hypothetical protein [Pirellulaceae bacterium]